MTLRKHFAAELERGQVLAKTRLQRQAYEMAVEGDRTMLTGPSSCA